MGVADFKKSIEDFSLQSGGNNNDALLKAAEELHSKYEMLVRIIRPASKEVDDFHKLLYVVYHTYLPGKEFSEIISVSGELLKKSEAIAQMKPSKIMESKSEKINSASNELLSAVKDLNSIKDISNEKEISLAVEKVHGKYQKLEEIF